MNCAQILIDLFLGVSQFPTVKHVFKKIHFGLPTTSVFKFLYFCIFSWRHL